MVVQNQNYGRKINNAYKSDDSFDNFNNNESQVVSKQQKRRRRSSDSDSDDNGLSAGTGIVRGKGGAKSY
jgi:hypothetical protein